MKNLARIKLFATDQQIDNKINSDRKHLILQDNKLFNPFKNEFYKLFVLSGLTNDKINSLDWVYNKKINKVLQIPERPDNNFIENIDIRDCEKIIATNDKNLTIKRNCDCFATTFEGCSQCIERVAQIPSQFIELFMAEYNKGSVINEVEVEYKLYLGGLSGHQQAINNNQYQLLINEDNTINISLLSKEDLNMIWGEFGKPKYGVVENGIFGTRIITGIVTGIRFTEDKPLYELSFGKDKVWTSDITDNVGDLPKMLKLVSLDRVKETHGLKIKYDKL